MKHAIGTALRAPPPAISAPTLRSGRSTVTASGVLAARRLLLPILLAALFVIGWEYGLSLARISPFVMAPPSAVWRVLEASSGILLAQAAPTVEETLVGFALASVVGFAIGGVLVMSNAGRRAFYPHILAFQIIPKVAVAPLFIVWFGVGPTPRVLLSFFLAFFPVVISTAAGLMSADRNVVRMAVSATATPWRVFRDVRVPFAVPHIFAGLKVAVTMAMIGVIVGEFVTAQAGLGYIIVIASSSADTALAFAAIAVLCVAGLALYGAVALVEWLVERRLGVTMTSNEF